MTNKCMLEEVIKSLLCKSVLTSVCGILLFILLAFAAPTVYNFCIHIILNLACLCVRVYLALPVTVCLQLKTKPQQD